MKKRKKPAKIAQGNLNYVQEVWKLVCLFIWSIQIRDKGESATE